MWNSYSVLDATGKQVGICNSYMLAIKLAMRLNETAKLEGKTEHFTVINHIPLFDTSDMRDMAAQGK